LIRWGSRKLTGEGTIRHGIGAGLRFDAAGGYPGYLLGTSEPREQDLLAQHLRPGGVFYDLGANIGFYSTIAARLVHPGGMVYAFEPHRPSAASAARNAAINDFVNVTVVDAAVGSADGRMTLSLDAASAKHGLNQGLGVDVAVVAIDQWIRRTDARPPTFVMIDVEGAEMRALDGMLSTLAEHRPTICCEVHWHGEPFLAYCRRTLAPLGYRVRNLDGGALPTEGRWHAVLEPTQP